MGLGVGLFSEMSEAKMGSVLKEKLKNICYSNGWSYGIFWRFDQQNSMLLTLEEAYYEEQMEAVVNNMLQQVHMLGEGIVGQAAFTGKHQWIVSDGSIRSQDIFQLDPEIQHQFSTGIKTIAVISVESRGVIQFGCTQKILETQEFLDHTKNLFMDIESINELALLANPPSSLDCESYDLSEWFDSFCNGNITPMHGGSCSELMEIAYASINLDNSNAFTSDTQEETMNFLCLDVSHPINQLQSQTTSTDAQVILTSRLNTQFQHVSSQSATSTDKSAAKIPCISRWSNEGSILTSLEPQLSWGTGVQDSPSTNVNTPRGNGKQNFQESTSTSSCVTGALVNVENTEQKTFGRSMINQHSAPSIHRTEGGLPGMETSLLRSPEEMKPEDFMTDFSNFSVVDNLFESSPLLEHNINLMASISNEDLSPSLGVSRLSSGPDGDVVVDIPFKQPPNSLQSSIIDKYDFGGQGSVNVNGSENDLFESLGLEFRCEKVWDCWEAMMPAVSGGHSAVSTSVSECISELHVGSTVGPKKGLFSQLGLEELLDSIGNSNHVTKTSTDDHLTTAKRRRMGSSSVGSNEVQLASVSCSGGSIKMQPAYNSDKTSNHLLKKEVFPKSQVGSWIGDSYSIDTGGFVVAKRKKPEDPTNVPVKRSKHGESTRPRPKDRQQIQDRIKELKGIIPDGPKLSIDALLDRTIKHILFLQSVKKYADKLKQADEPKLIDQENRMVSEDSSTSGVGCTWALEIGDQTMVCPIRVEDLRPSGLMLIEILCEDRGFFLEITDLIKGLGMKILKGVMEGGKDKIWARFIVEAEKHITRIEVFMSLIELLRQTAPSGMDSTNEPSNVRNGRMPPVKNYLQPPLLCPVSLAHTLERPIS